MVTLQGRFERVKGKWNGYIYRIVVGSVIRAEFTNGMAWRSRFCTTYGEDIPPPDVKFPLRSQPMPFLP